MSRVLWPLVPLYAAAVATKNLACDRGWVRQSRLQWPVVSVGNLSVGGSGKTPLVIRLAQLLTERGISVDVLSRGYGRRSDTVEQVDPGGPAEEFGDEPLLIAEAAKVPVFVGASRYAAGLLAENASADAGMHLLDDGFQHRRLARDADIVVLHSSDFDSQLLPAGRLREGFSSLHRAHILAMRAEDRDREPELRSRGFQHPIWWMERRLEAAGPKRVIAFCAIARPEEFFSALRQEGVIPEAVLAWRDHHAYSPSDIASLLELQRQYAAEAFVTTEKDLVRIAPDHRRMLEAAAPLHAAKLVVRLADEPRAIDRLLALLKARAAKKPAAGMRK